MGNTMMTSETVTEWANIAREAKSGAGRAYIVDVYKVAQLLGAFDGTLESFKAALAGNPETRGCLRRCDLQRAFDPGLLAQSAVTYRGMQFHMVER